MTDSALSCPNCGDDHDIIAEPPGWDSVRNEAGEWINQVFIEVNCFCFKCKTDFNSKHKLGPAIEFSEIRNDAEYPY